MTSFFIWHSKLLRFQVGAYFGHSVAVCDVNGDGYEDAVIGAPLHTNYDVPGSYETGRIYIVYQNSEVIIIYPII